MHNKPAPVVPAAGSDLSAGLRRYLYVTAAVTGAAILIVEILGAKMLSPFFGASHFVWTAQIAVTLVSLAAGYYFGGWLADRSPKPGRLYVCILLAAVYLCLAVLLCRPVANWCLDFKLALGSVLTSLFLFFVPLALLAVTGPFCIRVLTTSLSAVGGAVGRLTALGTIGSVVGTVLIGYLLIPFFPNSMTMFLTATVLMGLAAGYFVVWGKSRRGPMLLLGAIFLGLALGYTGISRESRLEYPGMEELERRNSNFGLMQVLQATNELRRYYLNDYLMQNGYDPGKKQSLHLFTYMLHGLARAYTPQINDALCIGLGIGIVPMQLAQEGARVDVVEINPAVVPLACRHFDLQTNKFNLVIDDGRHFLNRCGRRYDAIILDAFLGDSSPSHLLTREAFTAMRQALKPDGALVLNCFGELELGRDFFTASLEKTLRAVFKSVKVHSGRTGNIFMAASERSPFQFLHPTDSTNVYEPVQWQAEAAYTGIVETDPNHGRVLTDDFNPVEFHDAANRERLRRYLASRMRPDSEE